MVLIWGVEKLSSRAEAGFVMAAKIVYTKTDEAPALATRSFLPIVEAFTRSSGVEVELRDISLAGRIIANFSDSLTEEQRQSDALSDLGELAKTPDANIIKLPNISASIPQLTAAIEELRQHGYDLPDFPEEPSTPEEQAIRDRYSKVLGSAVNPVLREGNSDRRVAGPVKEYARNNPHSMGAWSSDSKTHVAHMSDGDFFGSEQSHVITSPGTVSIQLESADGSTTVLKEALALLEGEVIDAAVMSCEALRSFQPRLAHRLCRFTHSLGSANSSTTPCDAGPTSFKFGLVHCLSPASNAMDASARSNAVALRNCRAANRLILIRKT